MPHAPCLHHEAGDAALRVTLHIDDAAATSEPVLISGLEHAEAPVVRVTAEKPAAIAKARSAAVKAPLAASRTRPATKTKKGATSKAAATVRAFGRIKVAPSRQAQGRPEQSRATKKPAAKPKPKPKPAAKQNAKNGRR